MTDTASSSPSRREHYKLSVNAYDRAASLLVSLIVMVGVAVAGMLIVFFARQLNVEQTAIPVAVDPGERSPDAATGIKEDIEPPGLEEAPELDEPALPETLDAVQAASSREAVISDESFDSNKQASKGQGLGDNRQVGDGSGAPIREPRREVRFEPSSIDEYAQFLDAYKIELVVFSDRENQYYYATNHTKAQPDVRSEQAGKDRRLIMINPVGSALYPLDLRLARKAKISDKGQRIWHVYPNEAAGVLLNLEAAAADGKSVEDLQFTAFRVTRSGNRFTFRVEEQL